MKKKNLPPKSIQKILRNSFLATMLFVLLSATAVFVAVQYKSMKSSITSSIQQTCSSVAKDVDLQISQMDTVSINVLYSHLIKDTFENYSDPDSSLTEYMKNQAASMLTGLLTSIRGANSTVRQINLYNLDRGCLGSGNYIGYQDITASEQDWYEPTIKRDGYRYVAPPSRNQFLSTSSGTNKDRYYLSLYRLYFNNYRKPAGIVEVMQYYDTTFERAYHPDSSYNIKIIVYDPEGNVLFPLSEESGDLFDYFGSRDGASRKTLKNTASGRKEYVYYSDMELSGFTTAVAVEESQVFTPILKNLTPILLIVALMTALCYFIAYKLSQRLGRPLIHMYEYLSDVDFVEHWKGLPVEDSHVREIDKLRDSLNEFQERQKDTVHSMMLLKEQELQSQMLALQSQMNPHFLYNSLATLSAMAEEGMTSEISQMCMDITAILRYISSNKQTVSTLEDELEHAIRYLNCLKLRFGDALTFDVDVEDEMLEITMPKLCIQLLVENAVKFTTQSTPPPWHITIEGFMDRTEWCVSVKDNGTGFSREVIDSLQEKINEIRKSGLLPSLELDGMGLMNIYIRFYLTYHAVFIFNLGNLPEGGAIVTIGGKIND
nr:sensor histidine kinase [uncultured Blautia sp.]